jgi:copper chaperone
MVARDQAGGRRRSLKKKSGGKPMPEITVKGMSCGHCVAAMTKAMASLPGISQVQVDLGSGRVSYECAAPIPREDLERVVKAAGFELVGA